MQTTTTHTVTVEYTLHTIGNPGGMEYMVDTIDLDVAMRPSQLETRLQAGWQVVRQEAVEILDLCIVKMVESVQTPVVREDRYHVKYSA